MAQVETEAKLAAVAEFFEPQQWDSMVQYDKLQAANIYHNYTTMLSFGLGGKPPEFVLACERRRQQNADVDKMKADVRRGKTPGGPGPVPPPPKVAKTSANRTQHAVGEQNVLQCHMDLVQQLQSALAAMQVCKQAPTNPTSQQLAHSLHNHSHVISYTMTNDCLFEQAETLLSEAKAGCVANGSEAHGQLVQDWLCMHKYRGTRKHMHISPLPSTTGETPSNSNKDSTRCKAVVKRSAREKPVKGPVKGKAKTTPLAPVKLGAVVNGGAVLACSQCEKRYTDASLLEQHVKTKHTVSDHQCHICNKCLSSATNLKQHMATVHEGAKRHQCPTCGKAFGQLGNLVKHIKSIHEGQKFACDECGKQFNLQSNLKRHSLTHSGAKRYVCDICAKRFSEAGSLAKHRSTVHLHIKAHQCPLCEKRFGEAGHMRRHMRRVHSNEGQ